MERIPQKLVSEILEPRFEEIFTLVKNDLKRAGHYHNINGGVVISGGGSQLAETWRLASTVMEDLPVRVGAPRGIVGLADSVATPMHATGVGLAIQACIDGADATAPAHAEPFAVRQVVSRARDPWTDLGNSFTARSTDWSKRRSAPAVSSPSIHSAGAGRNWYASALRGSSYASL